MVARAKSTLLGMDEICKYVGYSAPTVLKWIREEAFPATQDCPRGRWESDTRLIDDWRFKRLENKMRRAG